MKFDIHEVPKWLDSTFFKSMLESVEGDRNIKINDYDVISISKGNDTYASPIFRAIVNYSAKHSKTANRSVIVKTPSIGKTMLSNDDISFDTEIGVYSSLLPEMQRLLKHSEDADKLAPNVLFYSTEPNPVIVLEDITELSFTVPTERFGLDETITTLYKLAKWHAASYHMAHDDVKVTKFNSGLFNKKYSENLQFMLESIKYFTNELETWPGFEHYVERFEKFQKSFLKTGEKIFSSNATNYNVLNHGDFTFKNLMIRRDTDDRLHLLFVDFQLCVWASPAIDLIYTLYMVASDNIRKTYRNELIVFYYNEFVRALDKSGFLKKPPGLLELHIEMIKNGFLEVVMAICFLPFLFIDSIDGQTDPRKIAYSNKEYQQVLKSLLPMFLTKGFV